MIETLSDKIYDTLLAQIIDRGYAPGDRLPSETALCEEFDVSRNTLRTALNKLSALGLVEARRGGGTYIKAVDSDVYVNFFVPAMLTHNMDLLEIMEFRKGMEVEIARLAAERATQEDIEMLKVLLKQCREDTSLLDAFAERNVDFHYCLAKASHNKMLEKMMDIVRRMILPEMKAFLVYQGEDIDSTFYHEMILRCVIDRKPEEAAFFMQRHLSMVVERVRGYISYQEEIRTLT